MQLYKYVPLDPGCYEQRTDDAYFPESAQFWAIHLPAPEPLSRAVLGLLDLLTTELNLTGEYAVSDWGNWSVPFVADEVGLHIYFTAPDITAAEDTATTIAAAVWARLREGGSATFGEFGWDFSTAGNWDVLPRTVEVT